MTQTIINAAFPPKLIHPLIESACRYIILHGGRGGGKSWAVARALLLRALQQQLRILCVREFMASITDSVHKLLTDQIFALGIQDRFVIEKATIQCDNGSEFRFAGIRNNVTAIKSFEGIDLCWAEEAANITSTSWRVLIPTIRQPNSQIIVSFNAELESDDTYQRFVISPPPNALVTKINYDENPFFPEVLRAEMEYMRENDPDSYQNVWLGYPKILLDNAVYARELRQCQEDGRITKVPYDSFSPVHCFYDLGWRDQTSIILAQYINFEFHIVDFVQGDHTTIAEFLKILQAKPYHYGTHYLPHDGAAKDLRTGRSIEQIMRQSGCTVRVVPRLALNDGINATKQAFERMWFDQTKCADLIQALRHYCYDIDGKKPIPVHDANSHPADALRIMALSLRSPTPAFQAKPLVIDANPVGWMA